VEPLLPASVVSRLRDALAAADFTVGSVADLIGTEAHAALGRNETTPALRRTADGSSLAALTRLWLLQAPVPVDDVERALPGLVDSLCVAGLLERSVGEVRAVLDVRPYADDDRSWWIVSDLTPGLDGSARKIRSDHVLGVSSASKSLAQLTIRDHFDSALDLGTGSGVQAMHLTQHVDRVVGTDLNPRCLDLAALTAELNAVTVELLLGSLYEPVGDATFDLIVSNPPFVISPATQELLAYRDSGLPGDELVRRVVTQAVDHLNPGGWCQILANWVHVEDQPWTDRLADWLGSTGCDAWVVQREVIDTCRYVEMWLDDAGLHGAHDYLDRYDAWLEWFDQQRVGAVGFGWLSMRKADRARPQLTIEEWPYEIEQPLGPHILGWGARVDSVDRASDADLLQARLLRSPDLVEERFGRPGDDDPESIVLRGQRGMRRARTVTTAVAAMVGACDGDLTLAQIVQALSTLLDVPSDVVHAELLEAARGLILEGFLDLPQA
jgi:hypothetical protein